MERLLTGTTVVLLWGAFNTMLSSILAGFTASGFDGTAGSPGALAYSLYAVSTSLVFVIAFAVWLGKRRHAGLRVPPRPGAAILLALAVGMSWLGLALGFWVTVIAAVPLVAAIVMETYPRERPLRGGPSPVSGPSQVSSSSRITTSGTANSARKA